MQRFYMADFNYYLNYHRPCGFATIEVSDNGKRRRHYRLDDYRTPYEKLLSLDDWQSCLKPGIGAARLEQQALRMSDTECVLRMQQRKRKLLDACRSRQTSPLFSPRGEAKCVRGASVRGARRLTTPT